jgi:hypothetical protein
LAAPGTGSAEPLGSGKLAPIPPRQGDRLVTGENHYSKAEELIRHSGSPHCGDPGLTLAEAQVHATLALTDDVRTMTQGLEDIKRAITETQ